MSMENSTLVDFAQPTGFLDANNRFQVHHLRSAALAEVHARPFEPIRPPTRLLHFAFLTNQVEAVEARNALTRFCLSHSVPEPVGNARHHRVVLSSGALRFEQHNEFATYTIEFEGGGSEPFDEPVGRILLLTAGLPQPGPLLVAVDLHFMGADEKVDLEGFLDPSSLAAFSNKEGKLVAATDFKPGADGFVKILVLDQGLNSASAGALAQRLLEIETYRTLALMGLPETQAMVPSVQRIETALTRLARAMTEASGLSANQRLLTELTALAAELEANAASAAFRFGATRAYESIVKQRLEAIDERPFGDWPTIEQFLSRRMAPSVRTCLTLEKRQADLSEKLSRAANLLRTRVDVEIEQQNRDLLRSMNDRTRLHLRLQQTVEGLSVAAVSYYIVGLISYLIKGLKNLGFASIDLEIGTAISVPIVIVCMWAVIRRIRLNHSSEDRSETSEEQS